MLAFKYISCITKISCLRTMKSSQHKKFLTNNPELPYQNIKQFPTVSIHLICFQHRASKCHCQFTQVNLQVIFTQPFHKAWHDLKKCAFECALFYNLILIIRSTVERRLSELIGTSDRSDNR